LAFAHHSPESDRFVGTCLRQSAHVPTHTPMHTPSAEPAPPVNGFGSACMKKPDPLKLAWGGSHKSRNIGRETRSRPPLVKRDTLEKELARELDTSIRQLDAAMLGASASRHNKVKGPVRLLHGLHAPPGISSSTSSSPSPTSSPLHSTPASLFVHAAGREGNEVLHTQQNGAVSADAVSPPGHAGVVAMESRYAMETRTGAQARDLSIPSQTWCPGESTGGQDERTVGRRGVGDAVATDGAARSAASGSGTGASAKKHDIHVSSSSYDTHVSSSSYDASAKKRLPKFDPSRFDDDICELFSSLRRR